MRGRRSPLNAARKRFLFGEQAALMRAYVESDLLVLDAPALARRIYKSSGRPWDHRRRPECAGPRRAGRDSFGDLVVRRAYFT